jgi:hypothetical protein
MRTLRGFIQHLATATDVTLPIGNILLGSHANSEGHMQLLMFPKQKGTTTFEILLRATPTGTDQSIEIPAAVTTGSVHFKGCNIGKADEFMDQFRAALGGRVKVTAPRHFHGLNEQPRQGTYEFMAYEFSIRRPTRFPDRAAVVAAFQAAQFKLVNNTTPVPNADWESWIPTRVTRTSTRNPRMPFGTTIGGRTTILAVQQFRVDRFPFTWFIDYPSASDVPPRAQYEAEIKASMQANPPFVSAYPMWKRLGYASFDDFFAGYVWRFSLKNARRRVHAIGTRVEYTAVIPIVVLGNLVINFNPLASSGLLPIFELNEPDNLFFGRSPRP